MTIPSPETLRLAHKYKMLEEILKIKERTIKDLLQDCGILRTKMNEVENEMARSGGCGV